ncbi:MAG TPA: hypothetical protein VFU35_14585 [Jatrophihabitans sp.]|nr:hypothetical protein [Jatrophihabitans sp.]
MSDLAVRVATAVVFVWLGMVLAISFLEAPLKFRAPGLELAVGLAIGRLVFRALNLVEIVWAVVLAVCLISDPQSALISTLAAVTGLLLIIQLAVIRPRLNRRSDLVLSGATPADAPRSHAHHVYIALECLKTAALVALGCSLLTA